MTVSAEECHEHDDHDQRPRGRLGEAEAADHLPCAEPAVDLHGTLGDEREDGVRAAERDDSRPAEEDTLGRQRAVPTNEDGNHNDGHSPDEEAEHEDANRPPK